MISVTVIGAKTSGNLGAIARVMKNFEAAKLYLVNPECEIITDESRARAMRAEDVLKNAVIVKSLKKVPADYLIASSAKTGTGHNLRRVFVTPEQLKHEIDEKLHYSIVLGREDKGLLNEELEACDVLVHIPASKKYKTLNISHALAIILYELYNRKSGISQVANRRERNAVLMRLKSASAEVRNYENFEAIFENLMNRAFIRRKEARALAGLFKHLKK
ncbi:rRNA methyltransferase [archaeon CG07_land_8_20_14_0_80_38_8]|nr:MAG: rRNA methyltransferase [archaeon CG07_land_8_20_14_0_80_38_8]PIU89186.1 MAG: rRNA methyltransferase [archaeon CG06_land_8_20_14_3_00_37_11]